MDNYNMKKNTPYSLPRFPSYKTKDYTRLTKYFLIRKENVVPGKRKSVIPIGISQGTEKGFSFTTLDGVKRDFRGVFEFIAFKMKNGYEIYDSHDIKLSMQEFKTFVVHSKNHTKGCYQTNFVDNRGYSFMERMEKRPPRKEFA